MKSISAFLVLAASIALAGVSCTKQTTGTAAAPTTITFLAVGDSYTIGELVTENERFAAQTSAILGDQKIQVQPITYIAKTGWRTDQILASLNGTSLSTNYNVVTVLAGVNDQYQHVDTATYRTNFSALLEKSILLGGSNPAHVYVLSMPDYSATPFVQQANKASVSSEIDMFNAINKELAEHHQCVYLDITPTTRLMQSDPSLIASDSLHPSGKEYAAWAGLLAPLINAGVK